MSLETQKMEARSTIKALTHQKSKVACRIASDLGFTGSFGYEQLDLEDERVHPKDKELFLNLTEKLSQAVWDLEKIEYPSTWRAHQLAFSFLNSLPLNEAVSFLRENNLRDSFDLCRELEKNPNFILEAIL